jgi:hypothetical protein
MARPILRGGIEIRSIWFGVMYSRDGKPVGRDAVMTVRLPRKRLNAKHAEGALRTHGRFLGRSRRRMCARTVREFANGSVITIWRRWLPASFTGLLT